MLGAEGIPHPGLPAPGQITFDGADAPLVPTRFVAVTTHWYGCPLAKPVTTIGLPTPLAVPVGRPSNDTHVAVYIAIGAPPLNPGTNPTDAPSAPASDADAPDGSSGTEAGRVSTVIRPIESPPTLSNHNAPSGPVVIPRGVAIPWLV